MVLFSFSIEAKSYAKSYSLLHKSYIALVGTGGLAPLVAPGPISDILRRPTREPLFVQPAEWTTATMPL